MAAERVRDPELVAGGALLGTFAGDALGAGWEGAPAVDGRDDSGRLETVLDRGTLSYTDDTQLALALAVHLCDHPQVAPDVLARTFLDHYQPSRGYGPGMHALIGRWRTGTPIDEAATSTFAEGSFGNGAAMRVAPVGVLWAHDPSRLEAAARRQARVTHVHPLGVDAAVVQARAVGLAAVRGRFGAGELVELSQAAASAEIGGALDSAVALTERWPDDPELSLAEVAARLGNAVVGHRSVPAALWAAAVAEDLTGGIRLTLGIGGDTDTISAMTAAVLGAAATRTAIPAEWVARLEDGPRGRTYALDLARRLAGTAARLC